jgi:hypothetical protein
VETTKLRIPMKNVIASFLLLFSGLLASAQVYLTVNVPAAGGLHSSMTNIQKNTVTDLTVTGILDARDFVILRDSMPVLSVLNLSACSIAEYTGTEGTFNNMTYKANEIPFCAFYNSSASSGKVSLTSVQLPATVHAIGNYAFQSCTGLTSADFPPSVDTLRQDAYHMCTGLITTNITSNIKYITVEALAGIGGNIVVDGANPVYSSLDGVLFNKNKTELVQCPNSKTSYVIPSSVSIVGIEAFYRSTNLLSLTIPSNVTVLMNYAFVSCTGLTTLDIPASVSKIPYALCAFCTSLQSVNIPEGIDTIGDIAFTNCHELTNLNLPSTLKYIGMMAFWQCSGMQTVYFPPNLTTILNQAFKGCSSLTEVNLSASLTSVTTATFYGCSGLQKVTIPASVTSIQNQAFYNDSSLMEVHANKPVPVDLSGTTNVFYKVPVDTCILYVPVGSKVLYEVAPVWSDFTHIVEDPNAGIETQPVSSLFYYVSDNRIVFENLMPGETLSLYTITGQLIYSGLVEKENISLALSAHGLYIAKCGNASIKFVY